MPGKILLAVTGSIAAFKAAKLASDLVSRRHDVRVVLTHGGARFVTPLTFEAITANPVLSDVWDEQPGTTRMGHLELARWADVLAVAPASAHTLTRLAVGLADDMLGSIALACRAPMLIAPAMESNMWTHPATQDHVRTLTARGAMFVGPESGRLASGARGVGRMAEPEEILAAIEKSLRRRSDLEGRNVLVTAGPTHEALDPVRYIANRSSGKMGYAVAEEARDRGAAVALVSGPTALPDPSGIELVRVESFEQMRQAVLDRAGDQHVIVMAAAVADFRPAHESAAKIKRQEGLTLELMANGDLAAELAQVAPQALHVGFALETEDLVNRAREKLERKGQDLVVGNELSAQHNPFGSDSNQVVIITREQSEILPQTSKRKVAEALWDRVSAMLAERS